MIEDKKGDITVPFCTPNVKFKGKKDVLRKYRERLSIWRGRWCKGLDSTSLEKKRRSLLQELEEASMPETKRLLEESIKLVLDNKKFKTRLISLLLCACSSVWILFRKAKKSGTLLLNKK